MSLAVSASKLDGRVESAAPCSAIRLRLGRRGLGRPRFVAAYLFYWAILFLSFQYDLCGTEGPIRERYAGAATHLVQNRLRAAADGIDAWAPLCRGQGYYISQFGLQGVAFSQWMLWLKAPPQTFAYVAATLQSALTAGVLAAFFASTIGYFGRLPAHLAVSLTALSPILTNFGPSLYWSAYTLFLPFTIAWIGYPKLSGTRWGAVLLCGLIFSAIVLKCLCGYEYVTTVILSPSAAVLFHQWRAGRLSLRQWAVHPGLCFVGTAAFAAAMALHFVQLSHFVDDPIAVVGERAEANIAGARNNAAMVAPFQWQQTVFGGLPASIGFPAACFAHYFKLPAASIISDAPSVTFRLSIGAAVGLFFLVAVHAVLRRQWMDRKHAALIVATLCGLVASLSWNALAVTHMSAHFHLNTIVFFVPFLPLAYLCIGGMLAAYARKLRLTHCGETLVLAACLFWLTCRITATAEARTLDVFTRNVVRKSVGHKMTVPAVSANPASENDLVAHIDEVRQIRPYFNVYKTSLAKADAWRMMQKNVSKLLVIQGWVVDLEHPGATKEVFVALGDQIVDGGVTYFGRSDVGARFGTSGSRSGFYIEVPLSPEQESLTPRVFVVSNSGNLKIREITGGNFVVQKSAAMQR